MTLALPTKFYLPPVPAGFVARTRLFEDLDDVLIRSLTLVSAPAGSGKTTLISAWAHSVRKRGLAVIGWLSLDESDNTPRRFWEYLAACLDEAGIGIDMTHVLPEDGEQVDRDRIPPGLVQSLLNLQDDLILVLDDYHYIQDLEIHAALGSLLEHPLPRLHFVLMTRSDPPLELARLRVSGQLVEIRMDQLRFSTHETAAFIRKSVGVSLTEAEVAILNTRTEGWIAGLKMAAISLRGCNDASAFVTAFAGSHRFVFDYLLEQVLNRQTPEVGDFLLKTSILDRFSAPLCDVVADTKSARRLLDILENGNLFLTSIDDERNWYRYHQLFSESLKSVLEHTYPTLVPELHRRASSWYEAQGLIPDAVKHALLAGDMELAACLVSENVLALVEHAELQPILQRMDAAPLGQRNSLPWLGVAHAWALAYSGQMGRADAALTLAQKRVNMLPAGERERISGHIAAVQAYIAWAHGSQSAAVEYAERANLLLPLDEIAVRALNLTTLGNTLDQYAASPRSVDVLEKAVILARQAEQSHVFMLAASGLAYAYISQGKLHKARGICDEAIDLAKAYQRRTGLPMFAFASIYAELASILNEWGENGPAIQAARRGLELAEQWAQADTILLCLIHLVVALSYSQQVEAAKQVLQRARKLAHNVSPWFIANVDRLEVCFWLDIGDPDRAARVACEAIDPLPASLNARMLLMQNRLDECLLLLEHAMPEALATPTLEAVRLGAIQSLAWFQKKDESRALMALKWTLELARVENRVMSFVREGERMERLLRLASERSICLEFTGQLLSVYDNMQKPEPLPAVDALVDPLSDREQEVLSLLNSPLSTPEIARQLFVSANTIRTHIKNIYTKLGVHGRSGAVKRARELGLIG